MLLDVNLSNFNFSWVLKKIDIFLILHVKWAYEAFFFIIECFLKKGLLINLIMVYNIYK